MSTTSTSEAKCPCIACRRERGEANNDRFHAVVSARYMGLLRALAADRSNCYPKWHAQDAQGQALPSTLTTAYIVSRHGISHAEVLVSDIPA